MTPAGTDASRPHCQDGHHLRPPNDVVCRFVQLGAGPEQTRPQPASATKLEGRIVTLVWETAEEVDFAGGDSIDAETRRPDGLAAAL